MNHTGSRRFLTVGLAAGFAIALAALSTWPHQHLPTPHRDLGIAAIEATSNQKIATDKASEDPELASLRARVAELSSQLEEERRVTDEAVKSINRLQASRDEANATLRVAKVPFGAGAPIAVSDSAQSFV